MSKNKRSEQFASAYISYAVWGIRDFGKPRLHTKQYKQPRNLCLHAARNEKTNIAKYIPHRLRREKHS